MVKRVEYNIFATIQATFHLDSKYIEDYKKKFRINDFDEYF